MNRQNPEKTSHTAILWPIFGEISSKRDLFRRLIKAHHLLGPSNYSIQPFFLENFDPPGGLKSLLKRCPIDFSNLSKGCDAVRSEGVQIQPILKVNVHGRTREDSFDLLFRYAEQGNFQFILTLPRPAKKFFDLLAEGPSLYLNAFSSLPLMSIGSHATSLEKESDLIVVPVSKPSLPSFTWNEAMKFAEQKKRSLVILYKPSPVSYLTNGVFSDEGLILESHKQKIQHDLDILSQWVHMAIRRGINTQTESSHHAHTLVESILTFQKTHFPCLTVISTEHFDPLFIRPTLNTFARKSITPVWMVPFENETRMDQLAIVAS